MRPSLLQTIQRGLMGVAAVSVLAMFAPPSGNTQGIGATAARTTTNGSLDPASLQKQLQALEKRVLELEKDALATAADVDASEAAGALVERRLRDNETAVKELTTKLADSGRKERQDRADAAKDAKNSKSDADDADEGKPTTITAPFMVVDKDGKPLFRVGDDEHGFSRGVYVFNSNGATVAHMGVLGGNAGGRFYVSMPNARPIASMGALAEGGLMVVGTTTDGFVTSLDKFSLRFTGTGGAVVALFGTKAREKGYMELNDSSGQKMVEAGMLNSQQGYVMASPYSASIAPQGDPSVLRGGKKK